MRFHDFSQEFVHREFFAVVICMTQNLVTILLGCFEDRCGPGLLFPHFDLGKIWQNFARSDGDLRRTVVRDIP